VVALIIAKLWATNFTSQFQENDKSPDAQPTIATLKAMQSACARNCYLGVAQHLPNHYPKRMTCASDTFSESIIISKAPLAEKRAIAREELEKMSEVMVTEKGLLNHVQASLVLGVSVKRVWELVRQGTLTRYDFVGRTYVSATEVFKRYDEEIAAGERIKQSLPKRVLTSVKAGIATDKTQWKLGGYAGPYHEARVKVKKAKFKEEEEKRRKVRAEFVKQLLDPMEPPKKKAKK